MCNRECGPKRLTENVALNAYQRKWLGMLNRESGPERLTHKVALDS